MKKILFLGRFPPPIHGAALMNLNYFEEIKKDKDFLIKKIKINNSESLDELGKINFKKFFGFFKVFLQLFFQLILFRPEIVYFEIAPKGFAFFRDSIFVLVCKIFRKKIIFNFQAKGAVNLSKSYFSKKYSHFIFRKAKVILLSERLFYDIIDFVNKEDVYTIPNSIKDILTEEKFSKIISDRKKNKTANLLFLSNMIKTKGPLDVLKICKHLKERKIPFICNFVGSFQDEKFKEEFFEELNKFKLSEHCFYLGPKYNDQKFKILEKTNYLLFPTYYLEETFGIVIIEALMYGVPVLSYDNAAIPEILCNKYLGYVAKQRDSESLYRELLRRIKNKNESPHKIRFFFKEHYQLKNTTSRLKKLFIQLS